MKDCGLPKGREDQCCLNHGGMCTLDTADFCEIDRAVGMRGCGFIGVNDRYLLWKYGVPYKELTCGNCGYYEAGQYSQGICANVDVRPHTKGIKDNGETNYIKSKEYYSGAHACGKFVKKGSEAMPKKKANNSGHCDTCGHRTACILSGNNVEPSVTRSCGMHMPDELFNGSNAEHTCQECEHFGSPHWFNVDFHKSPEECSYGCTYGTDNKTDAHFAKYFVRKSNKACKFFELKGVEKVPKQKYWTKCGRQFAKNSTAVVTGYDIDLREEGTISEVYQILKKEAFEALVECVQCPFKVKVTEGYPPIFKRWECRAGSREPNHTTEWTGSLEDKNTLNIHSLDHQLLEEILQFCKDHPDLGAGYNADHMADCRRTISVSCSSNKMGIAAKKELIDKFFFVTPVTTDKLVKKHHCGNCDYGHWFSGENTYTSVVSDDGIRTIKRPCDTDTHYCYQVSEEGQKKIAADKDFDPNTSPDWCPLEKSALTNQPEVKDDQYEGNDELFVEQKCRICGCTDNNACDGGCYWVEPDLCSRCAENSCDETNCPFNNGQGSCCFAEEDSECEGFQQIVIKAVDEYSCKNPDVCLTHKIIVDPDSCDVQGVGSNLYEPENETPENDTKTLENVNKTTISANDTRKPEIFDYSTVDDETAQYLREKAFRIAEISGKAKTLIGKELKDAQDELSKRGYGCFEEWYTAGGYSKTQVYRLINRYDFVCSNLEQASELEQLPDSLMYEISKPSAPKKLVDATILGDIKTHKDYKAMEEKLKIAAKDKQYWMEQANIASDQRDKEHKQREALLQEKTSINKNIQNLQQQLEQAKRNSNPTKVQELGKKISEYQEEIENYQQQIGTLNQQLAEKNRELKEKPIEVSATREIIPDEIMDLIYKKVIHAIEAVKFLTDREIEIFTEAVDSDETQDITLTIDSSMSRLRKIKLKMFDSVEGAK